MFNKTLLKATLLQRTSLNTSRVTQFVNPMIAQWQWQSRSFTTQKPRNTTGLTQHEYDYYFDSKIDKGGFPYKHKSLMKVLGEDYDTKSEQHLENLEQMTKLNIQLIEAVDQTMHIDKKEEDKLAKRGKFSARDRIRKLLDKGSPFLALGQLAGWDEGVPSGNIIAGIGMVHGRQCMIIANNFTFKGGAYYPITVKKHIRAQEIAM